MNTSPIASLIRPQFLASIDMLSNAIENCPEDLWREHERRPEVWRLVFHTLFWLDLYLDGAVEGFEPPPPFGLDELESGGAPPPGCTRDGRCSTTRNTDGRNAPPCSTA